MTVLLRIFLILFVFGCTGHLQHLGVSAGANNMKISKSISFSTIDKEEATRGLLAAAQDLVIKDDEGNIVWDAMREVSDNLDNTYHPLLYELRSLERTPGLYEVCSGIYQVRGFDISNITFIKGVKGWIVVDPLTTTETARAAYEFFKKHRNAAEPISAIIFTHSHVDHFGGILGIVDEKVLRNCRIPIIAPKGFMEEAFSENILLAPAMSRRAEYQFGLVVKKSSKSMHSGIGITVPEGSYAIVQPTHIVSSTPTTMEIDGISFVFQYAPDTEAVAEMTFYIPKYKAFCPAEIVNRTMHNLYTIRGTKVRDAYKWSYFINEAHRLFGDAEICFFTHLWPMYGNNRIRELLEKQADLYKFIHDQTIRLANRGYSPNDIANMIVLPEALSNYMPNRNLYGTLRQNVRAVYQMYLGWYDGNPAHLDPLPDLERAKKYIEYMGGEESVLEKAKQSYDKGDYRWVAEVLNHLIFAKPNHVAAKKLLADTYVRLAHQSESGVWRNAYLSAATELIEGMQKAKSVATRGYHMLKNIPPEKLFDCMAVNINPQKTNGSNMAIKINFVDIKESYSLFVRNSVLHHTNLQVSNHRATLHIPYEKFVKLLLGIERKSTMIFDKDIRIEGSKIDLLKFFSMFDKPERFPIVLPHR
ncbi:MAG: MBL fold metallo-hydrolase [Spirochaetes bacterium]|nr:MBL fold metallo-hydrolase [Spirochaetota bacterium]